MAQFVLIFGSHQLHTRQDTHKSDIEEAMLSGTVIADHTSAVHCKNDMQILQTNIMQNLIIRALQKGRVDRYYRNNAARRHTSGKSYRMLLGNTYVEITLWKTLVHLFQTSTLGHR